MALRVLQVVTYMGRGGLETMLMNYYRHIDRTQIQFDFLVHREFEADYDAEILALGGKIYRLPKLNPFRHVYLKQLDSFFAAHTEYKIVHSHLDCMAGIPLKYAKKHGVPVRIAHAHNSNQARNIKYILKLWFKRKIEKNANILCACGQEAGQWMFGKKEFTILNNAIDAKAYLFNTKIRLSIREEFGISKDAIVVGHVGSFRVQKNHRYLIEIFSKLKEVQPNAVLFLAGDGTLMNEIRMMVKDLDIEDSVIFAGSRKDVADLLQAMDVFCFPSLYEGLPVSIIEAQAAGLPCLISDKVPIACKITELVEQLPLETDKSKWVQSIIVNAKQQRRDTYSEIVEAGFDIKENAKALQSFYLQTLK